MYCCEQKMKTVDTRDTYTATARKKVCKVCGREAYTYELENIERYVKVMEVYLREKSKN